MDSKSIKEAFKQIGLDTEDKRKKFLDLAKIDDNDSRESVNFYYANNTRCEVNNAKLESNIR